MSALATLKKNGQFNTALWLPSTARKALVSKKLAARRKDYALMVSQPNFKAPDGTFHKPGSQK